MSLSKFMNRQEAAAAITELMKELVRRVEELKTRIGLGDDIVLKVLGLTPRIFAEPTLRLGGQ